LCNETPEGSLRCAHSRRCLPVGKVPARAAPRYPASGAGTLVAGRAAESSHCRSCRVRTRRSPQAEGAVGIRLKVDFKAVFAETSAVFLTRGGEVGPVAVCDVMALMVRSVAERMNMDLEEALHLVQPESVAEGIAAAADPGRKGAEHVYVVYPVRFDAWTVAVLVKVVGCRSAPRKWTSSARDRASRWRPGEHSV
jgi:hypothetical protein